MRHTDLKWANDVGKNGADRLSQCSIVTNVEIVKSGKVLTGKYKYVSVNGVEEGNTVCEWLVNGKVVEKEQAILLISAVLKL